LRQDRLNDLAAPTLIETKADDAIEQIVPFRDPVEHALNGSVAQRVYSRHVEMWTTERRGVEPPG
jgi:hypothetical protein